MRWRNERQYPTLVTIARYVHTKRKGYANSSEDPSRSWCLVGEDRICDLLYRENEGEAMLSKLKVVVCNIIEDLHEW